MVVICHLIYPAYCFQKSGLVSNLPSMPNVPVILIEITRTYNSLQHTFCNSSHFFTEVFFQLSKCYRIHMPQIKQSGANRSGAVAGLAM
jgi:hypothetical protein